ncbi:MAG: AI-2E family transporter [Microthrixaceae bacterium]
MDDEEPKGQPARDTPVGPTIGDAPGAPEPAPTLGDRMAGAPSWALPLATAILRRTAVAVVVVWCGFWILNRTSGLVGLILLSFFFSLALDPAVGWLHERHPLRRGTATGLMFLAVTLFLALLVLLLIPLTAELAGKLGDSIPSWSDKLNDLTDQLSHSDLVSKSQAEEASQQVNTAIKDWFSNFGGTALGIATTGLSLVFNLLTMGLFTFYLTANAPRVRRVLSSRLPGTAQRRFNWAWETAIRQTGGYFYSRLLLMIINGGLFFFVMVLVGTPVKYALPLSIFEGFVAEFIPAVGTYIGAAIPLVFVLFELGLAQALILLVWTIIYQQVENAVLSPKLSARTMSLNAGVAFGSALAGGALFGPMGAFVALPVAGMLTAFLSAYTRSYDLLDEVDAATADGAAPTDEDQRGPGGEPGGHDAHWWNRWFHPRGV